MKRLWTAEFKIYSYLKTLFVNKNIEKSNINLFLYTINETHLIEYGRISVRETEFFFY